MTPNTGARSSPIRQLSQTRSCWSDFITCLTQRAWIWAIGDRRLEFVFSRVTDFAPAGELKAFAIVNHTSLSDVAAAEDSALDRPIAIPWFDNLQVSVRDGLTQVAMHSHYHRGQNAARFRALGGDPPGTDFITWISRGRPAPQWLCS